MTNETTTLCTCEWCQAEITNENPVYFAEKPFHPWCREQFEEEMYGDDDPDPTLIHAFEELTRTTDDVEHDFRNLDELLNFF